jgi:hypothetical protein
MSVCHRRRRFGDSSSLTESAITFRAQPNKQLLDANRRSRDHFIANINPEDEVRPIGDRAQFLGSCQLLNGVMKIDAMRQPDDVFTNTPPHLIGTVTGVAPGSPNV